MFERILAYGRTAGCQPASGKRHAGWQPAVRPQKRRLIFLFALCLCVSAVSLSCTTKPSDLRTLVPAETLVYLETNDLAAALQPIVDSKPFSQVVNKKPDFSALKGVQVAIAVTGFETSEVAVTDEQRVGKVQPRFVAVADTHAWQFQTVRFAEQKLGSFVAEIYGSEPTLEQHEKGGGHSLVWTAKDGRKAFAVVSRSLIYFGNDESAIEKCLAVSRGEGDSIAKTGKLPPHVPGSLASGYISTDGVAQIAALAGLHFASQASDEEEVQSAVAGILPQLIRGTVTDVSWSTSQTSEGIEDKWSVTMPPEVANIFAETMVTGDGCNPSSFQWLYEDVSNATCYNFKNAQVAWRSVLLVAQKQTDPLLGKALSEFSHLLLESYGISDPELFFSASSSGAITANFSSDGEKSIVIAHSFDEQKLINSLSSELRRQPKNGIRENSDDDIAAFQVDFTFFIGDSESIKALYPFSHGVKNAKPSLVETIHRTFDRNSVSITVGRDTSTTLALIDLLAREGHGDTQVVSSYLTETRFTKNGMERRTVSDLGFIGWMIAQLAAE